MKHLLLALLCLPMFGNAQSVSATSTANDPCSGFKREVDEFTDEVIIRTPIFDEQGLSPIVVFKTIKNGKESYDMRLGTVGSTVSLNKTGVIVLFDDGTKWNKPDAEVDVDVSEQGFDYNSYVRLDESDMALFSNKKVKKFRLYIYDEEVSPGFANRFVSYVNCLKALE